MKFEGQYRLAAPREAVFQKLLDPEALARALPGCEQIQAEGQGRYKARIKVGVGAVKGTYDGRVEILDQRPPASFRIRIEGKGPGSFLKGEGELSLAEESGETLVSYSGDAQIGGLLASVGQRMMQAATRQIISQFFRAFIKQVQPT
jgi:uncharacterized protein